MQSAAYVMGLEAKTKVQWHDQSAEARVHLDSNKLDVFLQPALHLPFAQMRDVTARDGELRATVNGELLAVQLGAAAERWATKIRQPRTRADKLA